MYQSGAAQQIPLRPAGSEVKQAAAHQVGSVGPVWRESAAEGTLDPKGVELGFDAQTPEYAIARSAASANTAPQPALVVGRLAESDRSEDLGFRRVHSPCRSGGRDEQHG